jgi:hypothetical protein
MNLGDHIKLIEDMIRENQDYTIADYLELVEEIEHIKIDDMGSRKGIPNVTEDKRLTILRMAKTHSVAEICQFMGVSQDCVYKTCRRHGPGLRAIQNPEVIEPQPLPEVKKPAQQGRPPANYSNHSPYGIAS